MAKVLGMLCTRASLSWSPRPSKEKCGEQKKYITKYDEFKNPSLTGMLKSSRDKITKERSYLDFAPRHFYNLELKKKK